MRKCPNCGNEVEDKFYLISGQFEAMVNPIQFMKSEEGEFPLHNMEINLIACMKCKTVIVEESE